MALSGSSKGGIRSEVSSHVARTFSRGREVWRSRCTTRDRGHTISIIPDRSCFKVEARQSVSGSPYVYVDWGEPDRVDCDEALLPEDSWKGDLEEVSSKLNGLWMCDFERKRVLAGCIDIT